MKKKPWDSKCRYLSLSLSISSPLSLFLHLSMFTRLYLPLSILFYPSLALSLTHCPFRFPLSLLFLQLGFPNTRLRYFLIAYRSRTAREEAVCKEHVLPAPEIYMSIPSIDIAGSSILNTPNTPNTPPPLSAFLETNLSDLPLLLLEEKVQVYVRYWIALLHFTFIYIYIFRASHSWNSLFVPPFDIHVHVIILFV